MFFTIFYAIYFVINLLLMSIPYIPYLFLRLTKRHDMKNAYVSWVMPKWARLVVGMTGSRVRVTGLEHIPTDRAVCFISNHQGNFDIPAILGYLNRKIGFIAKVELARVPILKQWMIALNCIFIHRSNIRHSLRNMQKGIADVHKGHHMLVFPEGTRSKSPHMRDFKPMGVQIAVKAGVPIVPLTVNGSYHILDGSGKIQKAEISIIVHPLIETNQLSESEKKNFTQILHDQIESKLPVPPGKIPDVGSDRER